MEFLMVTHFNNATFKENENWRLRNNYKGSIYNSPTQIKETIPLLITLYVIEMNNETNKIMGIGCISNKNYTDTTYRIYEDRNYNRYTYKGKHRSNLAHLDNNIILELEERLFKSKRHFKRGQGLLQLPYEMKNKYINSIQNLFNQR